MGATYTPPEGSNAEFERPKPGPQAGRCIQVVDMGTVKNTHPQATFPTKREILIVWELAQKMSDGRPFVVNWKGTMSLGDNAHLTRHLSEWRGAPFTEEEKKHFEFNRLLDKPALVNVVEAADKKDPKKIWTNVKSLMPLPEGMAMPEAVNPLVDFGIDQIGTDAWNNLYPWVQTKIITLSEEGQAYLAEHPGFVYGQKTNTNENSEEPEPGTDGAKQQPPVKPPF